MSGAIDNLGANLIFLASQPRAGSTLLQRMLGANPQMHTTPEPWFMLEPCYALKTGGRTADYEAGGWARQARDEFLGRIGGRAALVAGLRAMACSVYGAALGPSGKARFLDKTPRYYAILPELAEVFPQAHIVVLLRNPLAVLCSVVRTWVQTHPPGPGRRRGHYAWERMPSYRDDLLAAPRLLATAPVVPGRVHTLRYEDLVGEPAATLRGLCARLSLPFDAAMLRGDQAGMPASWFGDPAAEQRHPAADTAHASRWTEDVRDPALWRLCADYLQYLERDVPSLLGYDAGALHAALDAARPSALQRLATRGLSEVLGRALRGPGTT
ncbi:MAG: sulfotransferase [Verrucomicrobia bacterium]|nr:sulfotransferase [Verrucomicrobiota bacterium]